MRAPSSVASLLRRMSLRAWPALLDSSGGPRELARWSFWAYDPMEVLTHDGRTSRVVDRAGGVRAGESNPFAALRAALGRFALPSGEAASPLRAGAIGFKGSRKGTPYAAQLAAADATRKAQNMGISQVDIVIRGTGSGREQAIRSIQATGVNVRTIIDDTPSPHNGCRPRKRKRP